MKKVLNVIRSHEWWAYKLPPLLALGYATALTSTVPLYQVCGRLLLILLSVVVGAVFVSIINDITDIQEDLAAGKSNRMAQIPTRYRWLFPAVCIAIGIAFEIFFYIDTLSRILYLLPWVAFSLYSFPPVRLKQRGILGVFADASGSHIFISLLMVSSVSVYTCIQLDKVWFVAIAVWAFTYGIRGILWHQFFDRENDLKVNLKTYATQTSASAFQNTEKFIIVLELIAFAAMLTRIQIGLTFIFLALYVVLVYLRYRILRYQLVIVIAPENKGYQTLMADYYQFLFPVSLMLYAALHQPWAWLVLIVHLLLFPAKPILIIKDLLAMRSTLIKRKESVL